MSIPKKFYRSQLATIVWDAKNEKVLADFKEGYFITEDKRTIGILIELGYPEVKLHSEAPPEGLVVTPERHILEGDAPLTGPIKEKIKNPQLQSLVKKQQQKSEKLKIPKLKKIKLNGSPNKRK